VLDDICTCTFVPTLTDEEEDYSEQYALSPTTDMSAQSNYVQCVTELAAEAESSRLNVSNLGYEDGAGFNCSLFASGQTRVFGKAGDSLRGDNHWLAFAQSFLDAHSDICDMADKAIQRSLADEVTLFDWTSEDPSVTRHFLHQSQQRSVYRGVNEHQMREIIIGVNIHPEVVVSAEGQMLRCILSARNHTQRVALCSLWGYTILRLGGGGQLEDVVQGVVNMQAVVRQLAGCSVGQGMRAAFSHVQGLHVMLERCWGTIIHDIFDTRELVLQGMQYEVDFCGLHPPEHCIVATMPEVVEGINGDPQFAYSPQSMSEGDESEGESEPDSEGPIEIYAQKPLPLKGGSLSNVCGVQSGRDVKRVYGRK